MRGHVRTQLKIIFNFFEKFKRGRPYGIPSFVDYNTELLAENSLIFAGMLTINLFKTIKLDNIAIFPIAYGT
jgi:hypothetical protein